MYYICLGHGTTVDPGSLHSAQCTLHTKKSPLLQDVSLQVYRSKQHLFKFSLIPGISVIKLALNICFKIYLMQNHWNICALIVLRAHYRDISVKYEAKRLVRF